MASYTLSPDEERARKRAVCHIAISQGSLIVLIDDFISRLVPQNPIIYVQIGLEDGGTQDEYFEAPGIEDILHGLDKEQLLLNIPVQSIYLLASRDLPE